MDVAATTRPGIIFATTDAAGRREFCLAALAKLTERNQGLARKVLGQLDGGLNLPADEVRPAALLLIRRTTESIENLRGALGLFDETLPEDDLNRPVQVVVAALQRREVSDDWHGARKEWIEDLFGEEDDE